MQILAYVRHFSEDIGFHAVGTAEHALADEWMIDPVQRECQRLVEAGPERKLEREVWHRRGSGAQRCVPDFIIPVSLTYETQPRRFDMMGKRLYKTYTDLTNIVIRVSDGTPTGKEHAVLFNANLDSTLPSPRCST